MKSPDITEAEAVCEYYLRNRSFLEQFDPRQEEEFFTVDVQRKLLWIQEELWEDDMSYRFYIFTKDSEEKLIGLIALNNIMRGPFLSCFLGYKLDKDHCRKGYMTEAVKRMVQFAFEDLNLHRIEGNIMPRNKASIRVVEKNGFKKEGISKKYLKINGVWEDHLHYVKLNPALE